MYKVSMAAFSAAVYEPSSFKLSYQFSNLTRHVLTRVPCLLTAALPDFFQFRLRITDITLELHNAIANRGFTYGLALSTHSDYR